MNPGYWLLRNGEPLSDDVAELALRLAMADRKGLTDATAWLMKHPDSAPALVRVVLGSSSGADACLLEHRLVPLLAKLEVGEREEVLHGMLDAFRSGRYPRWAGHADLVRLASLSGDESVRDDVLEPWFSRMALCGAAEVDAVVAAYDTVDPSGEWLVQLLSNEHDLPVEVLAKVSESLLAVHPAVVHLPWVADSGDEWAVRTYAERLLWLVSQLLEREHWSVLATLGVGWTGTLGDLVTCVREVS
jgi:hypothetical protein